MEEDDKDLMTIIIVILNNVHFNAKIVSNVDSFDYGDINQFDDDEYGFDHSDVTGLEGVETVDCRLKRRDCLGEIVLTIVPKHWHIEDDDDEDDKN